MAISERLRALDARVLGPGSRRPRRRTVLRYGIGLGLLAAVCYIASFWDSTYARTATVAAWAAGMALGRAQEYELAQKGRGLRPDEE